MENNPTIQDFIRAVRQEIQASQSEILTAEQAAAFLNIGMRYLYKLTSAGTLPYSKPNGKMIYFSRTDLTSWAMSNRSAGSAELEAKAETYTVTRKMRK